MSGHMGGRFLGMGGLVWRVGGWDGVEGFRGLPHPRGKVFSNDGVSRSNVRWHPTTTDVFGCKVLVAGKRFSSMADICAFLQMPAENILMVNCTSDAHGFDQFFANGLRRENTINITVSFEKKLRLD